MVAPTSLLDEFMPHGVCYQWRPDILWLNVLSDVAIAFAYFSIPIALLYFLRKRKEVPFPGVVYMFCIFIFACGVTHVVSIWVVWNGQYGFQGMVKAFTAIASVLTAISLYPVMPKLLALRSPTELAESNASLQAEMEQRKVSETQSLKLQGDLARLGRISTVGQMATGLAHELNQPLLAISASADTAVQIAKGNASNDPLLFECLDDIQSETQRAGAIIRALRQFISNKNSARSSTDINSLVQQAARIMAGEARTADVQIEVVSGKIPTVVVDSVQIAQVLVNLIRNAVEAISEMPDTDRLKPDIVKVSTDCTDDVVSVTVSDTGPGIGPGIDPFKAFETEKADGMGVGLSISRDIITTHGGTIEVDASEEKGATFTFTLPLTEKT